MAVPFFKKGKSRPTTTRKRSASPSDEPPTSQVVLPPKKSTSNLLSAGTKRKLTERDDDGDGDDPSRNPHDGPDVKWSADGSHISAALEIIAGDELEELENKRRIRQKQAAGEEEEPVPDDGQYHGQTAYRTHIKKSSEVPKAMRVGPQRNTSTIRTVTIIDYQPDVCKDYKETGYCGFGDTCKFLHDRGTYLAGWQLDKLAETPKKQAQDEISDSDSDDEDIPFACLICRNPYTDPVVTRCGHYFCQACAIKRFAKTPKCIACGAATAGIFNRADKVIAKQNKKRQEQEADEPDSDNDDGSNKIQIEGLATRSDAGLEDESDDAST